MKYNLIWIIEITSSNTFIFRNGGDLSRFVGVKIVVGLMRFIADGLLMKQGPNNIIVLLRNVFGMDIQSAIQNIRQVMDFWVICSDREAFLPSAIDFGVLNQAWIATNQRLEALVMPVDRLVNPNDRICLCCLKLILSQAFGVLACGHPMHKRC
jgi:hypothetical protein